MRKIKNAFLCENPENYLCFGCSPYNNSGLQLEFWENDNEVVSFWRPDVKFMGWDKIVHGGIQATLLDEVSSWLVYIKCCTVGVTTNLNIKYRRPLIVETDLVKIISTIKEKNHRFATINACIISNNAIFTEAELKFFLYPEHTAKTLFHYPGINAFFENV